MTVIPHPAQAYAATGTRQSQSQSVAVTASTANHRLSNYHLSYHLVNLACRFPVPSPVIPRSALVQPPHSRPTVPATINTRSIDCYHTTCRGFFAFQIKPALFINLGKSRASATTTSLISDSLGLTKGRHETQTKPPPT